MYPDEQALLHARALGILAALMEAAGDEASRQNLSDAYACLEQVSLRGGPGEVTPARVGRRRRRSDFEKLQETLLELSLCSDIDQSQLVRTMLLMTRAESHWVSPPAHRWGRTGRRSSDVPANAQAS